MRARNHLLAMLLPTFLLASCSSVDIPDDVRDFLNSFSPKAAQSSVTGASYSLEEGYYTRLVAEDGTYYRGDRVGGYRESFTLDITDGQYAYTDSETWDGSAAVENEDLGFVLVARTTTLTLNVDGSTWTKKTICTGAQGETDTQVDDDLLSGNARDEAITKLMGTYNNAYSGGLYYGDYLKTYSRTFGDYMAIESGDTLVFDPPATGVSEDSENYYDLMIRVNSLGLLEERSNLAYDETEEQFALQESSATYILAD